MAIYKCPRCKSLICANSNANNCTHCGNKTNGVKPVLVQGSDNK